MDFKECYKNIVTTIAALFGIFNVVTAIDNRDDMLTSTHVRLNRILNLKNLTTPYSRVVDI